MSMARRTWGISRMNSFFSVPVQSIDGAPDLLGPLRGKVTLAVNVASRCGYTPQYADLQKLQAILAARGYTDANIDLIFHGNWLRFFHEGLPSE